MKRLLKERKPELVYFDESYTGEYPAQAPFTISELEEIYPTASKKSKEDEAYREAAMQATGELQQGRRGYRALLSHILNVSVSDLKKNYESLNVSFDLWKGESDAQPYIPDMVQRMKDEGFAYMSDGALVVDVNEETDAKEVPPCIILKSDGASLYSTTDLATIVWRMQDYNPDGMIYLADNSRLEKWYSFNAEIAKIKQNSIENSFGIIYPSIGGSTWDRSPVVTPTYLFSDYILASYIKSATNQGVTTKVDIKALFCFEHVTDDSLKYLQDMINELQLESRSDRYQEVHFYFYPETEKDIDHIKESFSKMFAEKDTFKYYLMDNRRLSRIYYES